MLRDIRKNTVYVSKKDKEKILKNCKEIEEILEKYPASFDYSDYFVPTMMHVKGNFRDFYKWAKCLATTDDAIYKYSHFCDDCSKSDNDKCTDYDREECEKIKQSILIQTKEDPEGKSIIEKMISGELQKEREERIRRIANGRSPVELLLKNGIASEKRITQEK